jgi:hypothetical protein
MRAYIEARETLRAAVKAKESSAEKLELLSRRRDHTALAVAEEVCR